MATKAQAIDHLVDVLAGSDVTLDSQTVAGRITELADLIDNGTITIGSSVIVDSELSDESENPVQNKVVKAAIDAAGGVTVISATFTMSEDETSYTLSNATAICDALDAIYADPAKAFSYGFVIGGTSSRPCVYTEGEDKTVYAYYQFGSATIESGVLLSCARNAYSFLGSAFNRSYISEDDTVTVAAS